MDSKLINTAIAEVIMPKSKDDNLHWREEAGLLDAPHHVFHDLRLSGTQLKDRARLFFSNILHQIRCKWAISGVLFVVATIILLTTIPIFPLGGMGDSGMIGPQLDPQMRPCRSIMNFSPTPLPRIALASFMGSGNTWLRGAIEQITGIWTGSAYPDNQLYHGGFYGELTNNDKTILVKTHAFGKKATKMNYQKSILLIRKPEDAVLAKWNQYKTRTHTGIAKADTYETRDWDYFAPRAIAEWKETNEYWLAQNPSSIHVVKFEDLMENKKVELKKILEFIGFTDYDEDKLDCVAEKYEGVFKRRKYKLDFEPFNDELKAELESARDLVQQAMEEWKFSKYDTLELDKPAD